GFVMLMRRTPPGVPAYTNPPCDAIDVTRFMSVKLCHLPTSAAAGWGSVRSRPVVRRGAANSAARNTADSDEARPVSGAGRDAFMVTAIYEVGARRKAATRAKNEWLRSIVSSTRC